MKPNAIALSGAQYEIQAGDYQATVTELGAGLRQLSHNGKPLITQYPENHLPPGGAGQLLLPWPNRIDGGKYDFNGSAFQLELTEPTKGNAIHGLTRWASWTPSEHQEAEITLTHLLLGRPGYPFCLEFTAHFRLEADSGLQISITASNVGSNAAPYGTGCHPYLTAGVELVDSCDLELPAAQWLPTDDRGIPSGPLKDVQGSPVDFRTRRLIGDAVLDHALSGLSRDDSGRAWARLSSDSVTLGLWAGPGYDWLQVFTGDTLDAEHRRRALAIEPMTCPPNSFASGEDRLTLAPADSVTHTWGICLL